MDINKYLREKGYNTIGAEFQQDIRLWESWYRSKVRKFHDYQVYNGNNTIKLQRLSLGMAKLVSEDIADLLMNEKVELIIHNDSCKAFVEQVFEENNARVKLSEYQERKAYSGTVAYVPYLDDLSVNDVGDVVGDGKVKINFVQASRIFPLSWHNGIVSECAFVFYKNIDTKTYAHFQFHVLEHGFYSIQNSVVDCSNGAGLELTKEEWQQLRGFEHLVERLETGSEKPQFVIDRLNIVNNTEEESPMGIAIFANAIDILRGLDLTYDSYMNEFVLGKKRIFVAPNMLNTNMEGNPIFDHNDVVFYQLPEEILGDNPMIEVNMELRAEEHNKAINDNLNLLSLKCGFGTERYKFEAGKVATATEVISENSDMFRSLKKHEIILDSALKELVSIIIRLGSVIGAVSTTECEVDIVFDDSIIEDTEAQRKTDREDVAMGVMTLWEYRMKWYGEDEEEAKSMIVEQNTVIE